MTFHVAHVDKEFLNGGFEILVKWIEEDLTKGDMTLEQIHDFYNKYTFGPNKNKLTEDQFFIAFKSAELVYQDWLNFKDRKIQNQVFRRRI